MNTLKLSAGFFAAAASLGGYLATEVLRGEETRKGVAMVHGPLAATGLGLLVYSAFKERRRDLAVPTAMFAGAAMGGSYLFARDMSGKRPQASVTVMHGGIALSAIAYLVAKVLGGTSRSVEARSSRSFDFDRQEGAIAPI